MAVGNEPFRLGNYSFHRVGQIAQAMYMDHVEPSMLQPKARKCQYYYSKLTYMNTYAIKRPLIVYFLYCLSLFFSQTLFFIFSSNTFNHTKENNKSFSSGRGSRNFSLSSERYIVDQVNKSRNGSMNSQLHRHSTPYEREARHHQASIETCGTERIGNAHQALIVPHEDDIEKSFRVNEDGSMTVEMKVHLTVKEEEVLHWTTTLSRSSLSKRKVLASVSESGNSSPDSNNTVAKDSHVSESEKNYPAGAGKVVGFNDDQVYQGYTSMAMGKVNKASKRTPTPGPQHVSKRASIESVTTVTESGVQESTLGHYSYVERSVDGETTEGYRVVRHSSNSNRPIPKPRKTPSAGGSKKGPHSSIRSSEVAEVLQIQNNGMEVTETVMHIYESRGCYDNYFANEECIQDVVPVQGSIPVAESKLSTGSRSGSSSNDCDIDFSTTDSTQRQKEEMLSLSSEPINAGHEAMNNLSFNVEKSKTATNSQTWGSVKRDKTTKSDKKKKTNSSRTQKSSTSTSSSDKKQKESVTVSPKLNRYSPPEKNGSNKKSFSSSESARSGPKSRGPEKPQIKKMIRDEKMPRKEKTTLPNTENLKRAPSDRRNLNKAAGKDEGHNVNTPTQRPQMKKNMLDILQNKKSLLPSKRTSSKPKSITENKAIAPRQDSDLNECFSMPSLNLSPSEVHQYVENWLEKVSPDTAQYTEDTVADESKPQTKVVFQIGSDSDTNENRECQTDLDEHCPSLGDAVKKSTSCLSVPLCHPEPATALQHSEQYTRGLCVSMPSVRVDPVQLENRLRPHKSAEAIGPVDGESSTSNFLSPKEKIKPVLQQLCSSVQCIRRASDSNTTTHLAKANSLPDFPMQVASVFGSSCKAFLSFLSVMTLRDNLSSNQSRNNSEASLMMESLQKISTIEDAEEQRASLTDLQSNASTQFRERWKDFQILRERLESEPLSPRVSETEFALDVVSETGDAFEDQHTVIDELMEELNMPEDLRAEISSTIQQAKSFYPVEESTFVENERNQSETEEDVEKFVDECNNETALSPEPAITCAAEDITQTERGDDDNKQGESEQEFDRIQEASINVTEISHREKDELLQGESEGKEQVVEVEAEEERKGVDRAGKDAKEKYAEDDNGEETERGEWEEEKDEGAVTGDRLDDNEPEDSDTERESKEEEKSGGRAGEGSKQETRVDEEEEGEESEVGEKEGKEVEEGLMDEEDTEQSIVSFPDSIDETDEREGVEQTEEDEGKEGEDDDKVDEQEYKEAGESEVKKGEVDDDDIEGVVEVADEGEEVEEEEDEEEEEEESDAFIENTEEGEEGAMEEEDEGLETENITGEIDEAEEGTLVFTDKDVMDEIKEQDEEEVSEEDDDQNLEDKDEEEGKTDVVREESQEEEDSGGEGGVQEDSKGGQDAEVQILKDDVITYEKGEEHLHLVESTEEREVVETDENTKAEESLDEEEREDIEENETNESDDIDQMLDQTKDQELKDNMEEGEFSDDAEFISGDTHHEHDMTESANKYSSEGQCEDEKGIGTDTMDEFETNEGGCEERASSLAHPVEISQELLNFVNSALKSSSLIFTYDAQGNVRIEPDNVRVLQTKQTCFPKRRKDSYGLKCLPSPSTSDLSDYRPETSESGGYKSQGSVDIVTDSEDDDSGKPSLVCRWLDGTDIPTRRINAEQANSKQSITSNSEAMHCLRHGESFSSFDSDTKASREELSYFSAGSSQKADTKLASEATQCISSVSKKDSPDGVLIDQGRWLLKENHLIRKSPPLSLGMYGNVDSSSLDTSQENIEDSPTHHKPQHSPLAAISSSELEEMAKPPTPKCTYYNMPHGSDSDPFLDDASLKSAKKDACSVKGRGVRVSPTIDTSKTWANRNGSLSSFTSVEFKIPDRKVHPEGESSAVTQTRRPSSGEGLVVQAQDTWDRLQLRCSQYCQIL